RTKGVAMKTLLIRALLAGALVAGVTAGAAPAVTPLDGGAAGGATITVNNGSADQTDPHVDGDLATYTSRNAVSSSIHYYRFSTGVDRPVPAGALGDRDILSDARGNRIAFSRIEADRSAVAVYDTSTSTVTEIDPHAGSARFSARLGGNTVVFQDADA